MIWYSGLVLLRIIGDSDPINLRGIRIAVEPLVFGCDELELEGSMLLSTS